MFKETENNFGLSKRETKIVKAILINLNKYLTPNEWILVGGIPIRYHAMQAGESYKYPFNDIDLIARKESVLSPQVRKKFIIRHHHSNPNDFYFQLQHKDFPSITIDIFTDQVGEKFITIDLWNTPVRILIPEEMYIFKLRDILLLLDHRRGLPPKHIEELRLLEKLVNFDKVSKLWEERHKNRPSVETAYGYPSLQALKQAVEDALKQKKSNIKPWVKSDPLVSCSECAKDPNFPLYRDQQNS